MKRTFWKFLAMSLALLLAGAAMAQSAKTEHTLSLDDSEARVPATLEEVAWLVGAWTGEAFGGTFEEVWNPASAGSMVGMFKVLGDDGVSFYELMLLVEEEGSLGLKVKHFAADFTAWETKEDYVHFRLVRVDPQAVHFSGLSFYRINEDEIHGYIAMHNDEKVWEEKLIYRRSRP